MGVLTKYLLKNVLRFDHKDFMIAMRCDLGPLLGDTGVWVLKNQAARYAVKGADEKKKMTRTASDIIKKYIESEFDYLGKENKYNLANKFSPKKCPDKQVVRKDIPTIYSWIHYAPLSYFEHLRKSEQDIQLAKETKGQIPVFNLCSYCGSPESATLKHKRCSQCK